MNVSEKQIEQIIIQDEKQEINPKNSRINQVVEGTLTLGLNAGAIAATITQAPKSVLALTGKQILTATSKNWINRLQVPRVVSYPVLLGTAGISYVLGAKNI